MARKTTTTRLKTLLCSATKERKSIGDEMVEEKLGDWLALVGETQADFGWIGSLYFVLVEGMWRYVLIADRAVPTLRFRAICY